LKAINKNSHPQQADTIVRAIEPNVARLAGLISAYAPHDGIFELRIPGVHAVRRSRTNTELVHAMAEPALCIVGQGAKSVLLGDEVYEYDASRMIVFSVDPPVTAQVKRAGSTRLSSCTRCCNARSSSPTTFPTRKRRKVPYCDFKSYTTKSPSLSNGNTRKTT
jgi:hypothetical protein